MPRRFSWEILDHDSREDRKFRLNIVQYTVVGEIEAVGNLLTCPVSTTVSRGSHSGFQLTKVSL